MEYIINCGGHTFNICFELIDIQAILVELMRPIHPQHARFSNSQDSSFCCLQGFIIEFRYLERFDTFSLEYFKAAAQKGQFDCHF